MNVEATFTIEKAYTKGGYRLWLRALMALGRNAVPPFLAWQIARIAWQMVS